MRTPLCDQLGIEFPIFAFSHCRDVVAAVTNAGGFGVLGALAYEPERLEIELNWIDDHVGGRPYGVDFAMPAKYVGQGGGEEATPEHLSSLIPAEHRALRREDPRRVRDPAVARRPRAGAPRPPGSTSTPRDRARSRSRSPTTA